MSSTAQSHSDTNVPLDGEDEALNPWHYYAILRKRLFYLVVPAIAVIAAGLSIAILLPPVFLSEGRILVESQQIPTDLVRPTITATGRERLQVIEQRVMTRDHLLGILDKFQIFPEDQSRLSRTELLGLMRQNIVIRPIELDLQRRRNENATVAISVGFTHRRPDVAAKVANELMTLFLSEDARNRSARAVETSRFLEREVKRLESDLASVEKKFSELRLRELENPKSETSASHLSLLRAELAQKSALYSKTHPEIRRLRNQVEALEKVAVGSAPPVSATAAAPVTVGLEGLESQRDFIQKSLDIAKQKLSAARLGETLERDQFSERLEVIEQAVVPQRPIKPNRQRIIAFTFLLAAMAGIGAVFLIETFDRTIRGSRDLLSVAGGHLMVTIPYIATKAELSQTKSRVLLAISASAAGSLIVLIATHFLFRPLDDLWFSLMQRLALLMPF